MRRRTLVTVLLLSGLSVLSITDVLAPAPEDFEQWACCEGPGGSRLAARGPAVARYDPERDVTVAVFPCAHGYCDFAVRIQGDARGALREARIILEAVERPPRRASEPLDPPLVVPEMQGPREVEVVAYTPFRLASPWPGIAGLDAGGLLVVASLLVLWQRPLPELGAALLGAVAGLLLAVRVFANENEPLFISFLILLVLLVSGAVAAAVGWRFPRARPVAAALLLAAAGLLYAAVTQDAYFPTRPLM